MFMIYLCNYGIYRVYYIHGISIWYIYSIDDIHFVYMIDGILDIHDIYICRVYSINIVLRCMIE